MNVAEIVKKDWVWFVVAGVVLFVVFSSRSSSGGKSGGAPSRTFQLFPTVTSGGQNPAIAQANLSAQQTRLAALSSEFDSLVGLRQTEVQTGGAVSIAGIQANAADIQAQEAEQAAVAQAQYQANAAANAATAQTNQSFFGGLFSTIDQFLPFLPALFGG